MRLVQLYYFFVKGRLKDFFIAKDGSFPLRNAVKYV